jgi:hypothetical protein
VTVLRLEVATEFTREDSGELHTIGSWKTPPVLQVSAVCLLDTPKHMTGKSTLTVF